MRRITSELDPLCCQHSAERPSGPGSSHWIPARRRASLAREPSRGAHGPGPLSLADCRQILGPGCTASDEDLAYARDALVTLAHLILDLHAER